MKLHSALLGLLTAARVSFAAFGWSQSGSTITVDAGSANTLVYKVDSTNCDITSLVYRGTEYQSTESKRSHISSGLGSATVSVTTVNSNVVKITCVTSTLTHYYVTKSGESLIYMATYVTAEPTVGELRYIARLNSAVLTTGPPGSYTNLGTAATVEGSDVFRDSSGYTYSKFYSSKKFIDDSVHYISGDDVIVAMVVPRIYAGYESSSGGPFFRDIDSDRSGVTHALYFYMNSGHAQTESYRMGLHGPYALSFSRSGIPSVDLDTTFFSTLGITGYVTQAQRGVVSGTASGISNSYSRVIHWYNSVAQYWVYVQSNDQFVSPRMKPGTYTMKFYRDEYEVASKSVTVSAGATTTASITSTESVYNYAWTIGEFDGQPEGFQNADKQETMHPSDVRMSAWTAKTYTVGSSSLSTFPMAQIKALNNPTTIKFTLTSSQLGAATLRIATLLSFAGGRPQVTVNGWAGPTWSANGDPDSRGFTRGTYHGLNTVYTVSIPSGTLVSGTNTILINVISGSSGDTYLSPNFIYDAIGLITAGSTAAATTATTAAGTTTTTKTTATTTTTAAGSGTTVAAYGQCGGSGYTGSTTCAAGSTCVYSNEWYSQCIPS